MRFLEHGWPGFPINAGVRGTLNGVPGRIALIGAIAGFAVATVSGPIAGASPRHPDIRSEVSFVDTLAAPDVLPISMAAGKWRFGSVPSLGLANDGDVYLRLSLLDATGNHDAELHWYSPQAVVKESDLNPGLSDAQGAQNNRRVLALSIPRRPLSAVPFDSLWASLTFPLDVAGLDLSGARYIEVWVNDWRDQSRIRGPGVSLHIDLGVVSEDQMRAPDQPPNRLLDSEDLPPRDRVLVPVEDTGIDGATDATGDGLTAPLDLTTANLNDPAGDDYGPPLDQFEEIDPRRWARSNGTEANRSIMPFPDTEDLNLNDHLDTIEDYLECTIDLSDGDTPYLATDVYEEFAGSAVPHPPGNDNGWRLYRIPIDAAGWLRFGDPDLTRVRHLRVWVKGILSPDGVRDGNPDVMRPLLVLGGLVIAGELPGSNASATPVTAIRKWPNPARESVNFALSLSGPRRVELTVYDIGGRRLRGLSQGTSDAGVLSFTWDGRDEAGTRVPPGLYLIEARGSGFRSLTKVLLIE